MGSYNLDDIEKKEDLSSQVGGIKWVFFNRSGKPYYYHDEKYKSFTRRSIYTSILSWDNAWLKFYNQNSRLNFNKQIQKFNQLFNLKSINELQETFKNISHIRPWEKLEGENPGFFLYQAIYFQQIQTDKFEKAVYLEYMKTHDGFSIVSEIVIKDKETYVIISQDYEGYGLLSSSQIFVEIENQCDSIEGLPEEKYIDIRKCYKKLWLQKYRKQKNIDKFITETMDSIKLSN